MYIYLYICVYIFLLNIIEIFYSNILSTQTSGCITLTENNIKGLKVKVLAVMLLIYPETFLNS